MIHLEPITAANWHAAIKLKVRSEQEHFVASNLYSIAESQFVFREDDGTAFKPVPLAIYNDDEMVGFAMYVREETYGEIYVISRLMLDAGQQGKGYGRAALEHLITHIQAEAGSRNGQLLISYEPENTAARKLYTSLGFVENGETAGAGEIRAARSIHVNEPRA